MAETTYDVQGNLVAPVEVQSDEIFTTAEMEAIILVAENIDAVVEFGLHGEQYWLESKAARDEAVAAASTATTSKDAAAASAAAAGTSASNAATSAVASTNASVAAATDANSANAALAEVNQVISDFLAHPATLPPGGTVGYVVTKTGTNDYEAAWMPGGGGGTLDSLTDVDLSGAIAKDILSLNDAGNMWIAKRPATISGLDALSDVTIVSPAEGHGIYYDAASLQFKNKAPPALSNAVTKYPDIIGPTTVQYNANMVNKFGRIFCTNGGVTFNFDDDIVHPVGQVLQSLFRVYDADINPLIMEGNPVTGPKAVKDPPIVTNRSSGIINTAMANSINAVRTWTCPAGTDKCAVFIYVANPANTANPTDSPGLELDGTVYPWTYSAAASITSPRIFTRWIHFGDVELATAHTYRPAWVDYGGNGNVASFFMGIFSASGVDSFEPVTGLVPRQNALAASVTISRAILAGEINRDLEYFFARRSNFSNLLVNCVDATVVSSGQSGSAQNTAEMRHVAATEPAVPATTTAATMTWTQTGTYNAASADTCWMWRPRPTNMRLQTPDRAAQTINKDGVTLGIIYDSNDQVVEVDF